VKHRAPAVVEDRSRKKKKQMRLNNRNGQAAKKERIIDLS